MLALPQEINMKNIFIISTVLLLASCAGYQQKLNTVQDMPDEIVVSPPEACPNWSKHFEGIADSDLHSNYGCATVTNYGVMLTNPHDMHRGRGTNGSNAENSSVPVTNYRAGKAPLPGAAAETSSVTTSSE